MFESELSTQNVNILRVAIVTRRKNALASKHFYLLDNISMFLSALQAYVVFIIIAVVLVQYAFAVFCLLKLAYMDISRNRYILWNVFILIVFFIGCAVFLVYYSKHPELRISKDAVPPAQTEQTENAEEEKEQNVVAEDDTTTDSE